MRSSAAGSEPVPEGAGSAADAEATVGRAAASVAVWTLLSRALGMARILVIGAVLGPTYLANVFQAGYTLPNNVFTIFAGPMVAMVVVPSAVRAITSAGAAGARVVLSRVAGRLLTIAAGCAAGLALLSTVLGATLVLGVPGPEHTRAWWLAGVLLLFVAPQIVLYTVISLAVAAQQSRGRFALAAGAPALESIATVVLVVIVGQVFGEGRDVGDAPFAMVIWLGVGSTAAVAVHAGLQLYGVARAGLLVAPRWGLRHVPEAHECVRAILRSVPVAAAPAGTDYLLTVIAATVPGGVLVIQLASTVFYALSFVTGRAVSMAALPRLAQAAADADWFGFAVAWRQCLYYATLASLPPLCLLAVFARPAADLLSNGQIHQQTLVEELAACLIIAAFGQLVSGLHDLGRRALFSRLDDQGPRRASMLGFAASSLLALGTVLAAPRPKTMLVALMIAILVGEVVSAAAVIHRLRKHIRPERIADPRHGVPALLVTLAMWPAIAIGGWQLQRHTADRLATLLILSVTSMVAIALFIGAAVILGKLRPTRTKG
jgi:peptidoglycan biosynthesis protein MviN/MurJ (putative lipid II flippase)